GGGVGSMGGGVGSMGGGVGSTGGGVGATGGGTGMTGGGTGTCSGCTSVIGCQPGTEPFACGANGSQCMACAFGEQCVNGACINAACGPMTCAGCCAQGFCLSPQNQSGISCGSNGATCTSCMQGQSCVMGQCITTPPCSAATCPTGCCVNNQCLPQQAQNRFTCGTAGQMCQQCAQGESCVSGVCTSQPSCGPMSCPNGCCDNGQCRSGNSQLACGRQGSMCQRCPMGTQCTNGMCGGTTTPDAGSMNPAVGSPCGDTQDCQPPQTAICIPEAFGAQQTGYTGGYCTRSCGNGAACPGGSVCVTETFFGTSQSNCRASCSAPGTQSSCRAGYVCQPGSSSVSPGFCRPRCNNGGAVSGCQQGQTCNMATGVCT
ncbi:MAG: hypothetical protein ACO1OB_26140, partial [Archangium sp.]